VLQRDKDDHFVREMDEEGITGRGVEVDSEDAKLIGGILLHEYSADVQNEFSIKFIEKAKESKRGREKEKEREKKKP
jgi:hypothetical protein